MEASPGFEKAALPNPTGRDDLTRASTVEMRRRCRRRSEVANSRRSKKDASTALNTMTRSMWAYMVKVPLGLGGWQRAGGIYGAGGSYLPLKIGGPLMKKPHIQLIIVGNYWVFWSSKEVPSCVTHQNLGIFVNVESFAKRSESNNLYKFLL